MNLLRLLWIATCSAMHMRMLDWHIRNVVVDDAQSLSSLGTGYPPINIEPIFPTLISDVPSTAVSCWKSHVSWSILSSSVSNANESDKIKITLTSLEVTKTGDYTISRPGPDTTLCDGRPRVTGLATPTGSAPESVVTITTPTVSVWIPPSPLCTVDSYGSVCSRLYISMTSALARLSTGSLQSPISTPTFHAYQVTPPCRTPDTYPRPSAPITCSLETSVLTYKVLYWPVKTAGDFCAGGGTTVDPTQTIPGQPNTVQIGNLTMTSPTVYYIMDNLQIKAFAGLFHSNRASAWIPLDAVAEAPFTATPAPTPPITLSQDPSKTPISSAIISCNLGRVCYTTLQPFAMEDLATVPADKYYSQVGGGDPIYQGYYLPYYTLPMDLPTANKGWEKCGSTVTGWIRPTYIPLVGEE